MSNYESGQVTASVTGSVSTNAVVMPSGGTQITKIANSSSNAATTASLHTVTAGKTLYISSAQIAINVQEAATAEQYCLVECEFSSGVWSPILCASTRSYGASASANNATQSFVPPLQVGAGLGVRISSLAASAETRMYGVITGWEE